ncbi:glycerophosphoryl diester phosphodiesterase [Deinococcus metalli]|uniref:Glycerophosphoryl diester phosphodiesterase n=1 Tax=Deinococcus metalli TaxID=1141878 RepID=A0A7W8NR95_9DEIO|nr:glycerophosphodiester phosphodiesterase [Deinococcus metalli]MBB5376653.1 glycerophosphoryl diester phosphodiesterase [Deinococcus metalli]GHF42482.1 glycerophosphoryl diester phosphodiesterase [Deinococcus metalli]
MTRWRSTNGALLERRAAGVLRTAHGGAAWAAGPNTAEALRAALAVRPDYVELDVHVTRDGELLLWHDEHIVTPAGAFAIAAHPLADLLALPTPDGTLMTLPQALEEARGRSGVMIDLKAPDLYAPLIATLDTLDVHDALVCGGYVDTLLALKARRPDLPVSLTPDAAAYASFGVTLRRLGSLDAVTVYWRTVDAAMVEAAHALGVMVLAWTVDHPPVAAHLLALGVDGLTSNSPAVLSALRRHPAPGPGTDPRLLVPGYLES